MGIEDKILELKQDQVIKIENVRYRVLNKVKFIEKSSYWYEYKLKNIENDEMFYLNVELSGKVILYKILENRKVDLKVNLIFDGKSFELFEKGKGIIETYYGMTDVALREEAEYYEYKSNQDTKEILSIEKWKDETEVSLGREINNKKIKILNEFEI